MTRELKLAMVIGFALLLMLAMIVSDHLSTGAADHSTLVASAQPRLAATPPPVAVRGTVGRSGPASRAGSQAPASKPALADPPLAATTSRPTTVRPIGEARAASASPAPIVVAAATTPSPSMPAATPRTYRVAEGDSLSSIASSFYGDPGLWNKLAAANRDRLPNPDRMRVGLLLIVPDRAALDGGAAASANVPVRDPLVSTARTHVVGEGETLSEIAAAHLGSARRWPEIVAANRDRIDDPDRVQPGTELRLP